MQKTLAVFLTAAALVLAAHGKGVLFLRFDDRNFASWVQAIPVFERYGAHATFFVNWKIDEEALVALKALQAHGHSLGSHTMHHGNVPGQLEKLGKAGFFAEEIDSQLASLRKTGLVFRNFGYPGSKRTEESDRALLERFDRLSAGGFWEYAKEGRLESCDPLFFPAAEIPGRRVMTGTSVGACRPTVTGEVTKVLRRLAERDEATVLYAHNIRFDDKHDDHDLNIGELETILRMARSLGVRVAGFDDFPWIEKVSDNGLSYDRLRVFSGFDGRTCKVQPMIADDGRGTLLLSYQRLLLRGSDVFSGQFLSRSTDGGRTWSRPREQSAMADTRDSKGRRVARYATVYYSRRNGRWFALGNDETYEDNSRPLRADPEAVKNGEVIMRPFCFSVDAEEGAFTRSTDLPFPFPYVFCKPFGQIVEEDDGTLLVGFYYCPRPAHGLKTAAVFVRYRFAGEDLEIVEAGTPIEQFDLSRGVGEPSLVRFDGRYLLTLRSDEQGLVAVSSDGLRFSDPQPWRWDDGTVLANRNTQQHWVSFGSRLFLAYTRVDESNAHVFRNRAPIFLAEVDSCRFCLKRLTERPIVPERGARLGNFCVAPASDGGNWLVVSEWMQPAGCEKRGSDNSIWLLKFGKIEDNTIKSISGISGKATEQIADARAICRELGEIVPKLEASGKGQYSRMQYEVLRYSLDSIDAWELPKGRTNRVEQQAREMMDFAPAALSRAKRILSGEEQDLPVPRFKGGELKVRGPILFGAREWPDGREDRGHSVILTGWGHYAGVTRDQAILNRMGFNFQQMEIRMEDVLPSPGVTNLSGMGLWVATAKKAAANHTKIDFHPGLHYAPKWMTDRSSVTNCQNGFMHFCIHDEVMAKEIVDFARYTALQVKGHPSVSSICLTNEPQSKDVSRCPEFEKIWIAHLKEKFGTVEAMNAAWGASYPSFKSVRRCAFPKIEKTPECLELIRCERKTLADFNERIRNAVKEVVPEIPVHSKVVMDTSFLSPKESMFWCIDGRRFAEMMDWQDCDPVYFYDCNESDLYANVWQRSQASYDFLRSFAVKPMIDSENHNVVDNSSSWNPPEHFYSALWQNVMHGQCATAVWSWNRGGSEKSCFNGLLPSRPACLEAFARCSLDLQRLSDEIAPIQVQRPTILVMCSLASQVLGENGFLSGYKGASFVGEPLGVITDEALERFDRDGKRRLPLDTAKVIVLPSVTHLTRGALSALKKLENEGIRILVSGTAPAYDDCKRDLAEMPWKSVCGPHEQHIHPALVEMLKGIDLPRRPRLVRPVFGVETHSYERKGRRIIALCNHLSRSVEVDLGESGLDLISMKPVGGKFDLHPMMPVFVELGR